MNTDARPSDVMCVRCTNDAVWACFTCDGDYESGNRLHEQPDFYLCDDCHEFLELDASDYEASRFPYDEALVIA